MSLISILKRKNSKVLFTTPSHGGKFYIMHKFYQWYKSDISEVDAYNPEKALKFAEYKAAKIYGTKFTKFLTNGSTSGIIAAILASGCKNVLIWDNAHPCHKNGCMLAGANIIKYTIDIEKEIGTNRAVSVDCVEELLKNNRADGIIITSPTYEGYAADVKRISEICHSHQVKLIVDEAHGALYPFSDKLPTSAVKYADYTIQSLHKTAGGINPTALLHSNDNNPQESLKMINTTSPSYPMLATIEANINFLNSAKGRKKIEKLITNIRSLNIPQINDDVTKILLKAEHMTGFELSEELFNEFNIEDERTNEVTTMLLCGIGTTAAKLNTLQKAIKKIKLSNF